MKKNCKIFLFISVSLFFLFGHLALAQSNIIDSLKRVLVKTVSQDTSRVNVLNKLSEECDNIMDLDNAMKYANTAFNLARKINNLKGIAKALDNIGNVYSDQGNSDKAITYFLNALSIKKEIGNKKEIAYTCNLLGNNQTDYDEALKSYQEALKMNQEIGFKKGMGKNYNNIGVIYLNRGEYVRALDNYTLALRLNEELGNKKEIAIDYLNIGECYMLQGNYTESLNNQLASLKINEEIQNKIGILKNYNAIGIVNEYQLNYTEALKNYFISLKLAEEIDDKSGIANAYISIGNAYVKQNNFDEALKYQTLSLKINEERGDKIRIAANYSNIGFIYKKKGNYTEALKNHFTSLKINEELGDRNNIANENINIGDIYSKQGKNIESAKYFALGLKLSKETGNKVIIKESYNAISLLDSALSNWKSAYDNNKLYYLYRDSLINEMNTKKLVQSQMQYEFDKKNAANQLEQEKKNIVIAQEKQRQQIITLSIGIGLILVLVFSFLLYNRFKLTLKQKEVIQVQKKEVEVQKELVEEKNKQVTDSINYAKRIQTALMPSDKTIKENLPDSFIIYLPKDIVAGDFYWMEKVDDTILLAACDCTGHGVPGALVSVVCNNALNRAVLEFNLTQPADILNKTEEIVTENFAKNELEIKDGMDISLCSINMISGEFQWAGANNPLWIVKNVETGDCQLMETKADKQPIGINENHHPFTNHSFPLQKSDSVYLFTDGFADQFGGENGRKKITRKRFKELLQSLQNLSMEEQKKSIETFFFNYKKDIEQIDDILIIGVRI